VTSLFLHVSLYGLIGALLFTFLLGNFKEIKSTLRDSQIYSTFVDSVISSNLEISRQERLAIPLQDTGVQHIIRDSFDATSLQRGAETFVDAAKRWLDGDSAQLDFEIDFTTNKEKFAANLSQYAVDRLAKLPVCRNIPEETDVFKVECLPPNISLEELRMSLRSDFMRSEGLLEDPVITDENLPLTNDQKRIDEKFHYVPVIFQLLGKGILFFGGAFLLGVLLFMLARKPYRKGVRALGRDLATNGASLLLFIILFTYVLPKFTNNFSLALQGDQVAEIATSASELFIHKLNVLVINISIQVVAAGILLLVIEKLTRSSDVYKEIYRKAGVASSYKKPMTDDSSKMVKANQAPVQSSEGYTHKAGRTVGTKDKKYRKIRL
jgi:hypothetical protein